MNHSLIALLIASCLVVLSTAANSTVSTTACTNTATTGDSLALYCASLTADCFNYAASGSAASPVGRHCTVPKTGYFVYSDLAIQDATAGTDDILCSTSCSTAAVGTGSSVTPPCDYTTGMKCVACASGYFPTVVGATTPYACGLCNSSSNTNCQTCNTTSGSYQCLTCPKGTYPVGNSTTAVTNGNGNATYPYWATGGPTSCNATSVSNCAVGLTATTCGTCNTGYTLSNSTTCTSSSSFSKIIHGASFALVGAALYLLF